MDWLPKVAKLQLNEMDISWKDNDIHPA